MIEFSVVFQSKKRIASNIDDTEIDISIFIVYREKVACSILYTNEVNTRKITLIRIE